MIDGLPELLRMDLKEEVAKPLLFCCQLFRDLYEQSPNFIRALCFKSLTTLVATKKEYFFVCGDACSRMMFVESGKQTYTLVPGDGRSSHTLMPGEGRNIER